MTLMQQLAKKTRERRAPPAPYTGPDKSSANGNRPLTFPTPYHGGKRRWAEQILEAFGDERECVYVEPFSGSAAVLLANPRPYAREILCDTNPHISNVFRCLAWAPEATAFWADWPTTHQDLTARHTWLLRWAVDHVADLEADPDFHDPKAAGWWLWGKSNWIGTEFGIVRHLPVGGEHAPDKRPHVKGKGWSGDGVQPQRDSLPTASDKRPFVRRGDGGIGCNAQTQRTYTGVPDALPTAPDGMPRVTDQMGGQGIQPQRQQDIETVPDAALTPGQRMRQVQAPDKRPLIEPKMGGQGVQACRYDDSLPTTTGKIPHVKEITAGRGVSAQRHGDILYGGGKGYQQPAVPSDSRPMIEPKMGGQGVQVQRYDDSLPTAPDIVPECGSHDHGRGVSSRRKVVPPGKIPHIAQNGGGIGVAAQREGISDDGPPDATHGARGAIGRARQDRQAQAPRPTVPVPLTGDRLRPWFQALAERLYRVIILNRGWKSGLTPTVLQQTRTARKPPVRVLIDPPYKGVGKLYGMSEDDADELAIASWRWAAENGSREGWRIAYACREGDFDDEALALGWTCSKMGISANHSDSTQEVVWFSPHCLRPGQQRRPAPGEQGRMFETGE